MYYLPVGDDDAKVQVCRDTFLRTLSVGKDFVEGALRCKTPQGTYRGEDKRGKHGKSKFKDADVDFATKHIESFPFVESHYCRESTTRRYLAADLNLKTLYRLYKQLYDDHKSTNPGSELQKVGEVKYKSLFYSHRPKLYFHRPKKDVCAICFKHDEVLKNDPESKDAYQPTYDAHRARNEAIMAQNAADKEMCANEDSKMLITFDLQKLLTTPFCEVGLLYYKRKLNVYNFTVYECVNPSNGHCFLWDESEGKRGANEIASCLVRYIEEYLPPGITNLISYSDTCGGQNRNQHMLAALIHTVQVTNLDVLEQKFMESGHSQMEVDSMHSAIGNAAKNTRNYTPSGWHAITSKARNKKPYVPVNMYHDDFYDYKGFTGSVIANRKKADDGTVVNWLKIKIFRIEKAAPNKVYFKYNLDGAAFNSITIKGDHGARRSAHADAEAVPQKAYEAKLPITAAKKKDLLSMVEAGVVPRDYKPYYESLPTAANAIDELPESDADELDV